jgi:hypothetical protein
LQAWKQKPRPGEPGRGFDGAMYEAQAEAFYSGPGIEAACPLR